MNKIKNIFIYLGIFLFLLLIPLAPVWADCNQGVFLPPCTCSGNCQLTDFLALGANFVQASIGILAVFVMAYVIYGGFIFLLAMGSTEKIETGKKILGGTFRGLLIVITAWVIVNTVIFLLTGKTDGFLFGGSTPWWKFQATTTYKVIGIDGKLHEFSLQTPEGCFCPVRKIFDSAGTLTYYQQQCTNTTGWGEKLKQDNNCRSLGICTGDKNFLCCDNNIINIPYPEKENCPTNP